VKDVARVGVIRNAYKVLIGELQACINHSYDIRLDATMILKWIILLFFPTSCFDRNRSSGISYGTSKDKVKCCYS